MQAKLLAIGAVTVMVAACSSASHTGVARTPSPQESKDLKAASAIVKGCLPSSGVTGLLSHSSRVTFEHCMANVIPKSKRKAFESAVATAAVHGHLISGGHSARATFTEVTIPAIVVRYK